MPKVFTVCGFLVAAFLVIIFGVGLSQPVRDVVQGERPQVLAICARPPTEKNLRAYEKDMEDSSWVVQRARPWMQFVQYLTLKNLGRDVLVGRDGWFFYRPDVQFEIEPWSGRDEVVAVVTHFRDALAERGIRLLLVPAPGKPSVYPDRITARAARLERPVYEHAQGAMTQLQQAGIEIVDLFGLFDRNRATTALYLRQDTHWSPEGMQLAAKTVAERLLGSGAIAKGSINYTLKPVTLKRHGDVLRMARSQQVMNAFEPEQVECSQVVREDTGEKYKDDPESQVLVMGDSFLRIYERDEPGSAGFTAHLAHELGMPVTSIINDGGASTLVRQELNRKPEFLRNKKIVVWEFVERDLRFGTEGWQIVPLPNEMKTAQVP